MHVSKRLRAIILALTLTAGSASAVVSLGTTIREVEIQATSDVVSSSATGFFTESISTSTSSASQNTFIGGLVFEGSGSVFEESQLPQGEVNSFGYVEFTLSESLFGQTLPHYLRNHR